MLDRFRRRRAAILTAEEIDRLAPMTDRSDRYLPDIVDSVPRFLSMPARKNGKWTPQPPKRVPRTPVRWSRGVSPQQRPLDRRHPRGFEADRPAVATARVAVDDGLRASVSGAPHPQCWCISGSPPVCGCVITQQKGGAAFNGRNCGLFARLSGQFVSGVCLRRS